MDFVISGEQIKEKPFQCSEALNPVGFPALDLMPYSRSLRVCPILGEHTVVYLTTATNKADFFKKNIVLVLTVCLISRGCLSVLEL